MILYVYNHSNTEGESRTCHKLILRHSGFNLLTYTRGLFDVGIHFDEIYIEYLNIFTYLIYKKAKKIRF